MSEQLSRPLAVAAHLRGEDAAALEHLFADRRVLISLEPTLATRSDAHETVLLAVNEILRFCPQITLVVPPEARHLTDIANSLAADVHGPTCTIASSPSGDYDACLNIGYEVHDAPGSVTVSSNGWLARAATSMAGAGPLPVSDAPPNIFGALAAACLGAGHVFLTLVGRAPVLAIEFSVFTLETSTIGTLAPGPPLPPQKLALNALLAGCGGVAHGWIHAIKRAPVTGALEAVDHQSLRSENLGAYICSGRSRLKTPKAVIVQQELAGSIEVTPRPERFRFFKARIAYGQTSVPDLVISALDNPHIRHEVQRLWAAVTLDLAAEGLTSQVIVKHRDDDGMCLLEAHRAADRGDDELARLAAAVGLPPERLADFESEITGDDVAAAPPEKKAALAEARQRGQRICGRVGDLDLNEEEYSPEFAPAVPFVTAFTGIVAAGQTVAMLLGAPRRSLHFQFSFLSYRQRTVRTRCAPTCECRLHARPEAA